MMDSSAKEKAVAENGGLRRSVGLTGVVMLGAGTAIGVSIFTVLQPAAAIAGSGLLIAMLIAAAPMILFALVYAFMSSAIPRSGASFEWPSRFVHPLFGFLVAWLRILGSIAAMIVLATVLVSYLQMSGLPLFDLLDAKVLMAVLITTIFLINLVGVKLAAGAQTVMMVVLLLAIGLFLGAGIPTVDSDRIGSLMERGWPAMAAAVPLMITLFLGIETATEIGEEVRDARRTIPRGITLAVLLTALFYCAVAYVALGLLGPSSISGSEAPLLDAARISLGDLAVPIIVTAAAVAILQTMNAIALIFSRYLFAMGRTGALPAGFSAVSGRFGTPHIALLVAYVGTMAALALPSDLIFLLLAVNIPTMLKYLASCLSAVGLVRNHPQLHSQASINWSKNSVQTIAMTGAIAAVLIIMVGMVADWRPYLLVTGWGLVGLTYWYLRARSRTAAAQPLKNNI